MKKIDPESPIPKYYQIKDILKEMILKGKLKEGEKLATCRKLAEDFETTYLTINHSMGLLEKENLIRRIQGKGIFVNKPAEQKSFSKIHAFMTYTGDVYGELFSALLSCLLKTHFCVLPNDSKTFESLPQGEQEDILKGILEDEPASLLIDASYSFPLKLLSKHSNKINQLTFINRYEKKFKLKNANYLLADYFEAGKTVAKHLINKGISSKILFMPIADDSLFPRFVWQPETFHYSIADGVRAAMRELKINEKKNFHHVFVNSPDCDKELYDLIINKKVKNIFCCSDNSALNVYRLAAENGLEIGKDISVVGFFNTPWSTKLYPALSTVSIKEKELAEKASQAIMENWQNETLKIKPELIIRDSC